MSLSSAEIERLALLAEESAEVIHVVGKILRHGYESRNPYGGPTNRQLLEKELGDFCMAMGLSIKRGDVKEEEIADHALTKATNVAQYLHWNRP